MDAKALDRKIITIHKSTRTFTPIFSGIHNALRQRYKWYYAWHLSPWATAIHITALAFTCLLTIFIMVSSYFINPKTAQAASEVRHDAIVSGSNGSFVVCGADAASQYATSGYRVTYTGDTPANGTIYTVTNTNTTPYGGCPGMTSSIITTSPSFQVQGGGTVYLCDGTPTSPDSSAPCGSNGDTTPPTISNIQTSNITQTGATITWTTDETATHTLKYGTSSDSYDNYPNSQAAGSGTSASAGL